MHLTTPAVVLGKGVTALTVAQDVGRNSVPVYLLGSDSKDIAYHSRYTIPIENVDITNAYDVTRRIGEIAEKLNCQPVLLCCSDYFLQMVAANRNAFEKVAILNMPSSEAVATVLDKGLFGEFCARHDLPAPRSWAPTKQAEFQACVRKARFPVVIKPVFSHKAKEENFQENGNYAMMILAHSPDELEKHYDVLSAYGAQLLIQEYIQGLDSEHYSYVSCRDAESREIVGVGIRKERVFPVHAGVGTFIEVSDDMELATQSNILLDKLNYKGISSVCFKRDIDSGKLRLHEVNGRFPQGQATSQLCGVNLPYVVYQGALGYAANIRRVPSTSKKWIILGLDFDAFRDYRKCGELSTLTWLKTLASIRGCGEFAWDDLKPFLFFIGSRISRLWSKLFADAKVEPIVRNERSPRSSEV